MSAPRLAPRALLWCAIVVYVVAFAALSSLKLAWLRQGFDMAGNEQVIWNTLHGRPFRTSIFAFMQYDFDDGPVLLEVPLALLYGIYQSPYTLLVLQTLALGLAADLLAGARHLGGSLAGAGAGADLPAPPHHAAHQYV